MVIYVWTIEEESPELGGKNSFTSKCSEKSRPLDSTSKRLVLCINISYYSRKGRANYVNCLICSRNMIKKFVIGIIYIKKVTT